MTSFITDKEISQLITMDTMIPAIEQMFVQQSKKQASNLPRQHIRGLDGELAVMGASLDYEKVFGVKTYTFSKMGYSFHILLYSTLSGKLLAFIEANRLGQLRTGATTAVAVKHLARNTSVNIGMLGTGFQAMSQIEAVSKVLEIQQVKVYSRNLENRLAFAHRVSKALSLPVVAVDNYQTVVTDSDILISIASNTEPVIPGQYLHPEALIIAAGPANSGIQELDEFAIKSVSHFAVDSLAQADHEAGDIKFAIDKGFLTWTEIAELQTIVSGKETWKTMNGISYIKLMGTGLADIAAAKLAYDTVVKKLET